MNTTMKKTSAQEKLHGTVNETNNKNYNSIEVEHEEIKNETLVEIIPVEDTPFSIIRNDQEWLLTLGNYRLSEKLNSREEAEAEAKRSDWFRVMQVMEVMIKEFNNNKNQ